MSEDYERYLASWKRLHSGVDPRSNVWLRGYVYVVFVISRFLNVFKISPNVFTVISGVAIGLGLFASLYQQNIVAVALIAFIGLLLDGVDGALAILQDKASKFGAVLDSVNDRVQESLLYISMSWILFTRGYSLWMATALLLSLTATLLLEYARSRANMLIKVTVWERPTRILVLTFFVLAAFFVSSFDAEILYAMSALTLILSAIGLYQQFQDAKRQLL